MHQSIIKVLVLTQLVLPALASATLMSPTSVTAKDLNLNSSQYLGQQVTIEGKIDRILGNGAYVVSDRTAMKGMSNKGNIQTILVFTSNAMKPGSNQQADSVLPPLKEGDKIQVTGKVEQFSVTSEMDTISPKADTATVTAASESMPVIVARVDQLKAK